ncbi:hypothetical protein ACO2Q0_20450 [Phenylobacterium sp. VNQ135]|uniref:hypothetical protein n=1 Tax=Phenylobacterium sp. VNQ135 TaxID=3400922 RepID=UPI003C00D2F2
MALATLSTDEVLVWQTISSLTVLFTLIDFGFNPTFARIIATARGGGTLAQLSRGRRGQDQSLEHGDAPLDIGEVTATLRWVYRWIVVVSTFLTLTAGTSALLRPISNLSDASEAWVAWCLAAVSLQISVFGGANSATLTGFGCIATARRIDAGVGALQILTAVLVAAAGGGLLGIVASYSAFSLPLYLAYHRKVRRLNVPRSAARLNPLLLQAVWAAAWRSGVGVLMSNGIIQMSGVLYAQLGKPADAAAFMLLLRAITAVSQVSQAPFYSKLPEMSRLRAAREIHEVAALASAGMSFAFWTYSIGAGALLVLAPPLLQMIGSSVHLPAYDVTATLILAFFVERYCAMHIQLYSLTHHIIWHVMNGVTGVLMICSSVALAPMVGQLSFPLAMLISYSAFFAWRASQLSINSLGTSRARFELRTSAFPLIALLCMLTGALFLHMGDRQ